MTPEELAHLSEGKTVATLFCDVVRDRASQQSLRWKSGDDWQSLTYAEYGQQVARVASALKSLNVEPATRVSLLLRNSPEFYVADTSTAMLRATPTSVYNTSSAEQIKYQVNHAESRVAIVDDAELLDRLLSVRSDLCHLESVVVVGDAEGVGGSDLLNWSELAEQTDSIDIDQAAREVRPDDLATIIYTSGTTGPPKAAGISHAAVAAGVESIAHLFGPDFVAKRVISYMPMAHIAERYNTLYAGQRLGYTVNCCPEIQQMAEYVLAVKPQFFFGPPRIWEKMWTALTSAAEQESDDSTRESYRAVLDIGERVVQARADGDGHGLPADLERRWDELAEARSALKATVALDEVEIAVTAAAAMPQNVIDGLAAVDINLCDFYGMSEFMGATGDPYQPRVGTLGRCFPGVEIRFAEDGEIELRGPQAFSGYLNDPDKTAEVVTTDGWIRSGDLGRLDDDGYLELVGRKKELIVTAGGKNVSPAPLENALMEHPVVSQAVAVGDGQRFIAALVLLDPDEAAQWAKAHDIDATELTELACDPTLRQAVEDHINDINNRFSRVEQIKKFCLLDVEWTPDSDELTPTMKVKRGAVYRKYADQIDDMYAQP
jgi:long-chain acyl-CoA synthetase